jgi:hypothetical protein
MADQKYTVVRNLLHSGKRYRPGSTVTLSSEEAETLLDLKVISTGAAKLAAAASVAASPVALGASTIGKMTVAELKEYVAAHGIFVEEAATKDELVAAILAVAK